MSFFRIIKRSGYIGVVSSCAFIPYINAERPKDANNDNITKSTKWDWNWDKREPISLLKPSKKDENNNTDDEKLKKLVPTVSRHMIFIRHGQYNLNGSLDEDRILTKLGQEQAALTGERLNALSLPYTKLVHSTMTRATETADLILSKMDPLPVEKCDLLREGCPVPPEPPISSWKPEMRKFYTDGARIEAGFRKYFHRAPASQEEDSYEVYVCHANVIRYFVCRALQFAPEAWLRMSLYNGSITYMVVRPDGRVALKQLGDAGHMPPTKLSFS